MSNRSWNRLLFSTILLSLVWIYISRAPTEAINIPSVANPHTGFTAPDFSLYTIDGQLITLSKLRGEVVLINVWASWCIPCRAEMPAIENVYRQYRDSGFITLAVNSTAQDNEVDAAVFAQRLSLKFPILLDTEGMVSQLYQVRALPTSFFVGRDGLIREVVFGGSMNETTIASKIQTLLSEEAN